MVVTVLSNLSHSARSLLTLAAVSHDSSCSSGGSVLCTFIMLVLLCSGRRQRDKTADKKQDEPFIPGLNPIFRPNGAQQPPARSAAIGRARVATTDDAGDAPLDRSGYADLGLGLVRQASLEALDDIGEGGIRDRGAPRQDSVANRLEDSLSVASAKR